MRDRSSRHQRRPDGDRSGHADRPGEIAVVMKAFDALKDEVASILAPGANDTRGEMGLRQMVGQGWKGNTGRRLEWQSVGTDARPSDGLFAPCGTYLSWPRCAVLPMAVRRRVPRPFCDCAGVRTSLTAHNAFYGPAGSLTKKWPIGC
jgi:hypothetical protein